MRRLFDDPRGRRALVENFAGQWLELRNIREHTPDPDIFDEFDENLRDAMRRETELFIDSQLTADRSVVDLLNADYTFVNERLARHYGIPGVYGERFRRVSLGRGPGPPQGTARPGEPVDGDLVPEPDVAGAARQMGARKPARRTAAAAAAGRQHDAERTRTRAGGSSRCARGSRSTAATRRARAATRRWIRWDSRWRISTRWAAGGRPPRATARSTLRARSSTAAASKAPPACVRSCWPAAQQFITTVTEKLLSYALGRRLEAFDQPAVRKIVRDAAADDYRWSSLVRGIVASVPFQMRRSQS